MSSDPRTLETSYRWVVGSVSRGARLVSKQRVEFESFFFQSRRMGKRATKTCSLPNRLWWNRRFVGVRRDIRGAWRDIPGMKITLSDEWRYWWKELSAGQQKMLGSLAEV